MALFFGKSRDSDENGKNESTVGQSEGLTIEPEKARKWFETARVRADTRNYEYAITCYLNGLKFDPTNLDAHQSLLEVAGLYKTMGGKSATSKELREMAGGKRPVDKLAAAELAWVKDAMNASLALKFTKLAADLGLSEVAYWAAEKGALVVLRGKKPTKSALVQFVDIFEQINAHDRAVQFGQAALQLDPSDAQLEARIRNLSAQAAMSAGRYEEGIGEEGGFRRSVRDLEKQSELTQDESMALGSEASLKRLDRARLEWEAEPDDQNAIAKYADLLRKEGTDEADKEAIRVLLDGFRRTQQYRFRMQAGDVKLAMERRKLRAMRGRAESSGDPADIERVKELDKKLREAEVTEYQERVEKYPTDLRLKYELGRRLFELGRYDEAIPVLQEAHGDIRNRASVSHLIGLCFLRQEWYDEAIESLREAVNVYELKDDDTHLGMRYDLMVALAEYAKENKDPDAADEAFTLARGIAMKKLNFRDIKDWRDKLRDLTKELRAG